MPPDNVVITHDIQERLKGYLENNRFSGIAALVDENTHRDCLPVLSGVTDDVRVIRIRSGETNKNLETCRLIWHELTEACFDRRALLINLGGGVIGDMGGFCASTYKRGIFFINVPTTLLAQVDASVGGKLGIDFNGLKNHIGVFREPDLVLIDPVFLKTLPEKELRSGFAEVIKHALIADAAYWPEIIKRSFYEQDWAAHIRHSVALKKKVVNLDPKEKGPRKILNFGHTLGHALESWFLDKPDKRLLHGEAVAAGMILESYLSREILDMPQREVDEIENYIISVFGKVKLSENDMEPVIDLSVQDKKNTGGKINFSLLKKIGEATFDVSVSRLQMKDALYRYTDIR